MVEDITRKTKLGMEYREVEAGTSSMLLRRKGKQPLARSPHKKTKALIILLHILEGVQAMPTLLGCVEKLIYTYHDVFETRKFPKFAQRVYMESIGT
jgi:hypothetical protein